MNEINPELWHYDFLHRWNAKYYADVFLANNIVGDEIAIGSKEERKFYFPAKKDKTMYLIPSSFVEEGLLPFIAQSTIKTSYKGKAYYIINEISSVKIKAECTMTYRNMINNWMNYQHEQKDLFTLWKIIVDTAYCSRINARIITYPGWMKDSPLVTLSMLRGNCWSVNKPSLAKMKYMLNENTKLLGLNEIQLLDQKQHTDLAQFYEDTGDFKPVYINPTRSTAGSEEMADITNLSTLTFSNFPDDKKPVEEQDLELFDNIFAPKIRSRIMPILFHGGTQEIPACQQKFGMVNRDLTTEETRLITEWLRNHLYYEQQGETKSRTINYTNKFYFKNNRWDRTFQTVCDRIKLYANSQTEFDKYVELLFNAVIEYKNYMKQRKCDDEVVPQQPIVEVQITIIDKILLYIKQNKDCTFEQLNLQFKPADVEQIINKLKNDGEIYESKPGRYNIL